MKTDILKPLHLPDFGKKKVKKKTKNKKSAAKHAELIKFAKWLGIGLLGAFILFNLVFLIYPKNSALPFVKVNGLSVGSKSHEDITTIFTNLSNDLTLSIAAGEESKSLNFKDIGLVLDAEATAQAATQHREKWYLPVVSWWQMFNNRDIAPVFALDDEKFEQEFTQGLESFTVEYENATVQISEQGVAVVSPSTDGLSYAAEGARDQILRQLSLESQNLDIQPTAISPEFTTEEAESLADSINTLIAEPVSVDVRGESWQTTQYQRSTWVALSTSDLGVQDYIVDREGIASYVQSIANEVNGTPTNTVVAVVDGEEVSREEGQSAEVVNFDQAIDRIEQTFITAEATDTSVTFTKVDPQVVYSSSYSATNAGLALLISDWADDYGGTYGVVVDEFGGQGRYAEYNGYNTFVTASTYKMFVAYYVLNEIDNGNLEFDDPSGRPGWDVDRCLVQMITVSTNTCAIAFQQQAGWGTITAHINSIGFGSTNINNGGGEGGEKTTTPVDEANFLRRLNNGQLLSPSSTNYLLDLMKRQIYRQGVPAGVPGVVVADKVGFYDGWKHDAAIVYSPSGTYTIVVMTRWGTNPQMADLSARVYDLFN